MSLSTLALIAAFVWIVYQKSQKDKVIYLKKLAVLPLLFLYFLYDTITKSFPVLSMNSHTVIIIGLAAGVAAGFFIRTNTQIKADKEQGLVLIPASWLSAIILVCVVGLKFGIGYLIAVNPALKDPGSSQSLILFLLSFASSILAGSNLCYYMKYTKASSEHLEPPPEKHHK